MSDSNHLRAFVPIESLNTIAALDHVAAIHPAVQSEPLSVKARVLMEQAPAFTTDYPWYSAIATLWGGLDKARYTGQGQTIAIADTGMSRGAGPNDPVHPAFAGTLPFSSRIANTNPLQTLVTDGSIAPILLDDKSTTSHGTHVAGCAAGWNWHTSRTFWKSNHISGTAPAARIYVQRYKSDADGSPEYPWDLLASDMQRNSDAKIHNNSVGVGVASDAVQKSYEYLSSAKHVDDFTFQYPEYLIIFGAGNDGENPTRGPRTGTALQDIIFNRQVSGCAAAKNGLTVGGTWNARDMEKRTFRDAPPPYFDTFTFEGDPTVVAIVDPAVDPRVIPGGLPRNDPILDPEIRVVGRAPVRTVCSFSNKGPTTSNILKPEILAPGAGILSAASLNDVYKKIKVKLPVPPEDITPNACTYSDMLFQSGTSMAAPQVAGLAACLRQAAVSKNRPILGSTIRAILVNAAVSCSGTSVFYLKFNNIPVNRSIVPEKALQVLGEPPDCVQGFGQANYRRSVLHIDQASTPRPTDGYWGPIGFYQAGDKLSDGIITTGNVWPEFLTDVKLKKSSYIIPGRNNGQLRVTLAYNDLSSLGDLDHEFRLEIHQFGYTPAAAGTVGPGVMRAVAGATRGPDPINTYPDLDLHLTPAERTVTFGTVQKVTWRNIDASVLQPGEVMAFQMRVIADAVSAAQPIGRQIGFSLAWISSVNDDF